jgi:hypothetical protein
MRSHKFSWKAYSDLENRIRKVESEVAQAIFDENL